MVEESSGCQHELTTQDPVGIYSVPILVDEGTMVIEVV
jgi:hypothetical protein